MPPTQFLRFILVSILMSGFTLNVFAYNSTLNTTQDDEVRNILVSISQQALFLTVNGNIIKRYPVSTSAYGIGNLFGSNKTPLGIHQIKHKIGHNAPLGQIFVATSNTGEIAEIHTDDTDLQEDFVLTRILWLEGVEPGLNRGGKYDSFERRIYIHGTNEEGLIGTPASHGCIRMNNTDIIELFNQIARYDQVLITE